MPRFFDKANPLKCLHSPVCPTRYFRGSPVISKIKLFVTYCSESQKIYVQEIYLHRKLLPFLASCSISLLCHPPEALVKITRIPSSSEFTHQSSLDPARTCIVNLARNTIPNVETSPATTWQSNPMQKRLTLSRVYLCRLGACNHSKLTIDLDGRHDGSSVSFGATSPRNDWLVCRGMVETIVIRIADMFISKEDYELIIKGKNPLIYRFQSLPLEPKILDWGILGT